MKKSILASLVMMAAFGAAHAETPKETIEKLDARLTTIGAAHQEAEEKIGDKTAPALIFGKRKINGNYDVVDDIKKATGATATIFSKAGDEFVRVSTNVLTPEGKRGVGTFLARGKAYDAVSKGEAFCGQVDVLGTAFDACYHPIKADGKVIGVTYIGYKVAK